MLTFGVGLDIMQDKNATVAELVSDMGEVLATGSAKRAKGEKFDSGVGINLAVARALRNWADEIEAQAYATIENGDGHSIACYL